MSLIKTGGGITDIRGGFGGVYFTRDRSGLHSSAKPRRVHQRTAAQNKQRNCFSKARTYSKDERVVSYLIYRCLNDLPFIFDAIVTGELVPDSTSTYELAGTYNGKDYYRRKDGMWYIWWVIAYLDWIISHQPGSADFYWIRDFPDIVGDYQPTGLSSGIATVALALRPPPADYQIPKL